MPGIEQALHALGELERCAGHPSPLCRLDPRAGLVATLAFALVLASYPRYSVSALLPLAAYPLTLLALSGLAPRALGWRLLAALPLVLCVGLFNPLLDRTPQDLWGVPVPGGWLSLASLVLRFVLTVSAALALVAAVGFARLTAALPRLGLPRAFATQLLLLHRYIFVLCHEALRLHRACTLRAGGRGVRWRVYAALLGQLLLRTLGRAERIHRAMLCRGFDGSLPLARPLAPGWGDVAFVAGWGGFFALARLYDLPVLLGRLAISALRGLV